MIEILCSGLEGQMLLQLTSRTVWCPGQESNLLLLLTKQDLIR